MGVYDSYGKLDGQLKVGACRLDHYAVGDKVYIHDGVYVTYTNVIVVIDGVFVAEFEHLWDKWRRSLQPSDVITNPLQAVVDDAVKKHK